MCIYVPIPLTHDLWYAWQPHHGRVDEHDQLSHSYRPDVYPAPSRVYPPLGRARRVGSRRLAQQPFNWKSDGELCLWAVLHRGRTRWFAYISLISDPN